jgi:hypothetical protein
MRRALILSLAGLTLAACATAPKQTLATLNRHDPEYRSRDCRQARRDAARFDDHKEGRIVLAVGGNLILPFAGTAAAAAIGAVQEDEKKDLNHRLKAACTSDPLKGRRTARR